MSETNETNTANDPLGPEYWEAYEVNAAENCATTTYGALQANTTNPSGGFPLPSYECARLGIDEFGNTVTPLADMRHTPPDQAAQ